MFEKRYTKHVLSLLAIFVLSTAVLVAQNSLDLDLKLRNENKITPIPKSGEFSLSLDSQMFDRKLLLKGISDLELEKPATEVDTIVNSNSLLQVGAIPETTEIAKEPELNLLSSKLPQERNFSSTLTLTTGYNEDSPNLIDNSNNRLKLEKQMGKFKIFGEFEQRKIARIPIPENNQQSGFSANAGTPIIRASVVSPKSEIDEKNKNSALASRYYLEAVYSFKPAFQGKVSYKRSMVDTIDSEEKLQVEGIVEANRNLLIKAGYNNETRPEVNEPKATKNSKVWTEFILKF
ncbi:MAG: hypothetical protein Kow0029_19990 [Candidatus Rifleibacteriota bacterium]